MKIAIVGAGFAGLAAAWHLLQLPSIQVTLYDALPIGQGTSGMAAGLLHPFAGLHAKPNWRGEEGVSAALPLLQTAARALGSPVFLHTGILRVALNETASLDYRTCAEKHPEVEWVANCQAKLPSLPEAPGIFISNGYKVFGDAYLQGLWLACAAKGARFERERVDPPALLATYDLVVAATGGLTPTLHPVKGQLLKVKWPKGIDPLPFPIAGQYYIAMDKDKKTCFVGGTYEHAFTSTLPDIEKAVKELWPKALELFPPLKGGEILEVKAGLRASTPDHKPLLAEVIPRFFLLSGFGSKGLLYSSLYAQDLASSIAQRL